jgi:hypothetical protein
MRRVALHETGVDASFLKLAAQIVTAGIASDTRTKQGHHGARIDSMMSM